MTSALHIHWTVREALSAQHPLILAKVSHLHVYSSMHVRHVLCAFITNCKMYELFLCCDIVQKYTEKSKCAS